MVDRGVENKLQMLDQQIGDDMPDSSMEHEVISKGKVSKKIVKHQRSSNYSNMISDEADNKFQNSMFNFSQNKCHYQLDRSCMNLSVRNATVLKPSKKSKKNKKKQTKSKRDSISEKDDIEMPEWLKNDIELVHDSGQQSSVWLSETERFDRDFEEMVKITQKQIQSQPLHPDPLLDKHHIIFGIVPNQRLLDRIIYRNLISKSTMTKDEKGTLLKLEKFLESDKMTHKELAHVQELRRKRQNLELDNNSYQKQINTLDDNTIPDLKNRDITNHEIFDREFFRRYQINIRTTYNKKKQQKKEEAKKLKQEIQQQKQNSQKQQAQEIDYFEQKEKDKEKWYLFDEKSFFIQAKRYIMFWVIMYSCLLYPIELLESQSKKIHDNANLDFHIGHFGFERDHIFQFYVVFFEVKLMYTQLELQLVILESVFLLDIFLNFLIIRTQDQQKRDKPITSAIVTAHSYYNDGFWFDFLVWFPLQAALNTLTGIDLNIFNIIRCLRLVVLNEYLCDQNLKQKCMMLFDLRFNAILKDTKKREDFYNNWTIIEKRILINNIIITIKIVFYTFLALYFTGTYTLCFSLILFEWSGYQDLANFYCVDELIESIGSKILRSFYFALTTLSTVGFGDFYPKSDGERLMGSLMILIGVALFSIIISEFLDMINEIGRVLKQETDDEMLEWFFAALRRFNHMKHQDPNFINDIQNYMNFKWTNDKNNFLEHAQDELILRKVRLKNERTIVDLYTKFIYRNLLKRFNRFFSQKQYTHVNYIKGKSIYEIYGSKKFNQLLWENQIAFKRQKKRNLLGLYYPMYSYNDQLYLLFMTSIFASLEIRNFSQNVYLANELEDCQELLLVDQGYYKIGFNINNEQHLKLTFGPSTRIGAYNLLYEIRHEFIIKSISPMFCYAIRLEALYEIFNENPQFKLPMKRKEISNYARNIYFPLMSMKRDMIQQYDQRKDYEQVICFEDDSNQGLVEKLTDLYLEEFMNTENNKQEQSCLNEINDLNEKLKQILEYSIHMRQKLELALQTFQLTYLRKIRQKFQMDSKNKKNDRRTSIFFVKLPQDQVKILKHVDLIFKDMIFTNKEWKKLVSQNYINKNPKTKEQIQLIQLFESYMGPNRYQSIRDALFTNNQFQKMQTFSKIVRQKTAFQNRDMRYQFSPKDKQSQEEFIFSSSSKEQQNNDEQDVLVIQVDRLDTKVINNKSVTSQEQLRQSTIQNLEKDDFYARGSIQPVIDSQIDSSSKHKFKNAVTPGVNEQTKLLNETHKKQKANQIDHNQIVLNNAEINRNETQVHNQETKELYSSSQISNSRKISNYLQDISVSQTTSFKKRKLSQVEENLLEYDNSKLQTANKKINQDENDFEMANMASPNQIESRTPSIKLSLPNQQNPLRQSNLALSCEQAQNFQDSYKDTQGLCDIEDDDDEESYRQIDKYDLKNKEIKPVAKIDPLDVNQDDRGFNASFHSNGSKDSENNQESSRALIDKANHHYLDEHKNVVNNSIIDHQNINKEAPSELKSIVVIDKKSDSNKIKQQTQSQIINQSSAPPPKDSFQQANFVPNKINMDLDDDIFKDTVANGVNHHIKEDGEMILMSHVGLNLNEQLGKLPAEVSKSKQKTSNILQGQIEEGQGIIWSRVDNQESQSETLNRATNSAVDVDISAKKLIQRRNSQDE